MKARYYDPAPGRFCSQDPGVHGTNWFIYSSDNPVNRVDPSGRVDCGPIDICGILLAGLVGGGVACLLQGHFSWVTFISGFASGVAVGIACLWGPVAGAVAGAIIGGIMGYFNGGHSWSAAITGAFFGALAGAGGGAVALAEGAALTVLAYNVALGLVMADTGSYSTSK